MGGIPTFVERYAAKIQAQELVKSASLATDELRLFAKDLRHLSDIMIQDIRRFSSAHPSSYVAQMKAALEDALNPLLHVETAPKTLEELEACKDAFTKKMEAGLSGQPQDHIDSYVSKMDLSFGITVDKLARQRVSSQAIG